IGWFKYSGRRIAVRSPWFDGHWAGARPGLKSGPAAVNSSQSQPPPAGSSLGTQVAGDGSSDGLDRTQIGTIMVEPGQDGEAGAGNDFLQFGQNPQDRGSAFF